jgi:hypothetical protein
MTYTIMNKLLKLLFVGLVSTKLAVGAATAADTKQTFEVDIEVRGKVTSIKIVGNGSYNDVLTQVMALRLDKSLTDKQVINHLNDNLDTISPLFFLEASHRLCLSEPNEAANWYAAYVVRSVYDGKRCTDKTAGQGFIAAQLTMPMSKECQQSIEKVLKEQGGLFDRYIEAAHNDNFFSPNSSPMWLCSHGIDVFLNTLEEKQGKSRSNQKTAVFPSTQWPKIREEIIEIFEEKKRQKDITSEQPVK